MQTTITYTTGFAGVAEGDTLTPRDGGPRTVAVVRSRTLLTMEDGYDYHLCDAVSDRATHTTTQTTSPGH